MGRPSPCPVEKKLGASFQCSVPVQNREEHGRPQEPFGLVDGRDSDCVGRGGVDVGRTP